MRRETRAFLVATVARLAARYINGKLLLFPQTRTLQPSNAGEAAGMMFADLSLIALESGSWLRAIAGPAPHVQNHKVFWSISTIA